MAKEYPFYEKYDPRPGSSELLYVIGDVHGCHDQLVELLKLIGSDIKMHGKQRNSTIVFVGDYIDRGPKSFEVVEEVFSLIHSGLHYFDIKPYDNKDLIQIHGVALRGNHEKMLQDAILSSYNERSLSDCRMSDSSNLGLWMMNGGFQTSQSYQASMSTEYMMLPAHHIKFYNELHDNYWVENCGPNQDETWMVVHAGVNPDVPLEHQDEMDYLWIRQPYIAHNFLSNDYHEGKLRVISGHTPVKGVHQQGGKVLLDTACVFGEKLTCCVFDTREEFKPIRTLQVKNPVDHTAVNR